VPAPAAAAATPAAVAMNACWRLPTSNMLLRQACAVKLGGRCCQQLGCTLLVCQGCGLAREWRGKGRGGGGGQAGCACCLLSRAQSQHRQRAAPAGDPGVQPATPHAHPHPQRMAGRGAWARTPAPGAPALELGDGVQLGRGCGVNQAAGGRTRVRARVGGRAQPGQAALTVLAAASCAVDFAVAAWHVRALRRPGRWRCSSVGNPWHRSHRHLQQARRLLQPTQRMNDVTPSPPTWRVRGGGLRDAAAAGSVSAVRLAATAGMCGGGHRAHASHSRESAMQQATPGGAPPRRPRPLPGPPPREAAAADFAPCPGRQRPPDIVGAPSTYSAIA
jgi:hypothetical protein